MGDFAAAARVRGQKQLWTWWVLPLTIGGGWFYPPFGYLLPLCMLAGMGIAWFRGRSWCDWMCPRGSSWDRVLCRFSAKKDNPPFFRSIYFRLMWLMILMGIMGIMLPRAWPSLDNMGRVFVTMLTVTTAVGIVLGIAFQHRNWCLYCPIGTMGNWLGRGKYPLIISSACTECYDCYPVCPVQIKRWEYRPLNEGVAPVKDWDCLKCGLCVEVCPSQALTLK